ncbi:hypothetical protein [Bacillus sp. B-jedd]|uniref:hypothetical protein n=1 Tax=Bacillus sp. B-jedd TaxID=1476857 RepID=UPI00051558D2|nr:hypothetical protein [Bacillus sp. B-jedd]CEG28112.1 hypothetical protein BN1002_02991 [Bacillus sp. B-jedd]
MDKLGQLKADYKRGCMSILDIKWALDEVERLKEENRIIRQDRRFRRYMSVLQENLNLIELNATLQDQLEKAEAKLAKHQMVQA